MNFDNKLILTPHCKLSWTRRPLIRKLLCLTICTLIAVPQIGNERGKHVTFITQKLLFFFSVSGTRHYSILSRDLPQLILKLPAGSIEMTDVCVDNSPSGCLRDQRKVTLHSSAAFQRAYYLLRNSCTVDC